MTPPAYLSLNQPLAWPSDVNPYIIDEPIIESNSLQKPEPKLKDGGINYVW